MGAENVNYLNLYIKNGVLIVQNITVYFTLIFYLFTEDGRMFFKSSLSPIISK